MKPETKRGVQNAERARAAIEKMPDEFWLVLFPDWRISAKYRLYSTLDGLETAIATARAHTEFAGRYRVWHIRLSERLIEQVKVGKSEGV
jgi:hypothetical protein